MPLGWHRLAAKHPLVEPGERLPVIRHEVRVHVPGVPSHQSLHHVCRTPGISCEGRDHLEPPTMTTDRGAADDDAAPRHQPPFVCFIPLFDSVVATPTPLSAAALVL